MYKALYSYKPTNLFLMNSDALVQMAEEGWQLGHYCPQWQLHKFINKV